MLFSIFEWYSYSTVNQASNKTIHYHYLELDFEENAISQDDQFLSSNQTIILKVTMRSLFAGTQYNRNRVIKCISQLELKLGS